MCKRILSVLLCLVMVLSLVPVGTIAAAPGASEYCDHAGHDGATWTKWEETTALPVAAGNYYLSANVTISTAWEITQDIHLCLNGHSITQTGEGQRVGNVRGGAELSIYDCSGKDTAIITGGSAAIGAAFYVHQEGLLALYGGAITGNSGQKGTVYVAGAFNLYGGELCGNTASETGSAILAEGGLVGIYGGHIMGNTAAAGAAVCIGDTAKLTVGGVAVIAGNTNRENTADVVLQDKLYVNELEDGSSIHIQTAADQTEAEKIIAVDGTQTASWQAGWVDYRKSDGSWEDIGYITSGSGKKFVFGHYHGDQEYTAYNGGANHNLMKTNGGYYYLTHDVIRNTNSSGHLSLNAGGTEQHLCLNGHRFVHRNPAIRLYLVDAGDKLFIEDCTSYRDSGDNFVAGGIFYGGSSDSTVTNGSAIQVNAGGQLTLDSIQLSGFHSTKSPALRVLGEADNRGQLTLNGVQITDNTHLAGNAAVLYANTGATVTMTDCVIKNNQAKNACVVNTGGDARITMTDCIVTGNTTGGYGVCNVANGNTVFKLQGATRVTGNTGGNLHLQNRDVYVYNVDGLTQGAKVGITLHSDRISGGQMHFTSVIADGKNPKPYCYSDEAGYVVILDDQGRLALAEEGSVVPPHSHAVCGETGCTDHGAAETWQPWEDATKLPETPGSYYLTCDVEIANRAAFNEGEIKLCLNGHTVTAADSYAKSRAYYLRGTAKLTITDCAENPGKLTGFQNTALMFDGGCTDAKMELYRIGLSGNSCATTGGAIVAQGASQLNTYDVKVTNNQAGQSVGAIFIGGSADVKLENTQVTGNTAGEEAGGIQLYSDKASLTILGSTQITDNTADGKASNLQLWGDNRFTAGQLTGEGRVGISVTAANRQISTAMAQDWSQGYVSDDAAYEITFKDNALYIGSVLPPAPAHSHTVCGESGCTDHGPEESWEAWEDADKLPSTPGNYYLTTDVTITNRAAFNAGQVKLCLNGHTVTAADSYAKSRAYYLRGTAKLTITDCAENPGKLTGFQNTALMFDGGCTDAKMELYRIGLSGNSCATTGGAIVAQGGSSLYTYGVTITDNQAQSAAGIYIGDQVAAKLENTTITGNTAGEAAGGVQLANAKASLELLGSTRITGNTANTKASNLELLGEAQFIAGTLTGQGTVGITAARPLRQISAAMTQDWSQGYTSDDPDYKVVYRENALHLAICTDHVHCLCGGGQTGCDHGAVEWLPWRDSTKLPEAPGSYYLTCDVTVTHRASFATGLVQLCLNGHTITVAEDYQKGRAYYLYGDARLVLTDCAKTPGAITGAKESAIMCDGGCTGAQIDVYHITFTGNETTAAGGAICLQGAATLNLYSGTLTGNRAVTVLATDDAAQPKLDADGNQQLKHKLGGGAIGAIGGKTVVNLYGGTVTKNEAIRGSYLSDGQTAYGGGHGGGIYCTGQMNLYGGAITNNQAQGNGGGLLFGGNDQTLTIQNVLISGNSALNAGGLLAQNRTSVVMNGGDICDNSTQNAGGGIYVSVNARLVMNAGQVRNNTTNGKGGGICGYGAVLTLNGGSISGNSAKTNGGGITVGATTVTVDGEKTNKPSELTIRKGFTITGNKAAKNAGGVYATGKDVTVTLDGGAITGNTADGAAGGILTESSSRLLLQSGTISGNRAKVGGGAYISTNTSIQMTGGAITDNSATGNAGGIQLLRSTGSFSGGSVTGNKAEGHGGGMYLSGADVKLTGTYIAGNEAVKNGGGVVTGQASATKNGVTTKYQTKLVLQGSTITENTGVNGGGVLIQSYTVLDIISGTISKNRATSAGGVYASTNSTVNMTGGNVTDNYAEKNGGGLYHLRSTGNYTGGNVLGNTCGGNGAAFLATGVGCVVNIKGLDLHGFQAGTNASVAVCQGKATMNFEDCKFHDNQALAGSGAVYISTNSFGSLKNCEFYNNTADKNGGAFMGDRNCKVTMENCSFRNNTAGENGGAILCRGTVYMTDCMVSGNTAGVNGGGIATNKCGIRGSKFQEGLVLTNVQITDNKAAGQGGGLYLSTGCRTTMTDVAITGNTAGAEGGGFWAVDDTTLLNVTVTGNTSGGEGFAAWYDDAIYDGHSYFVGVHKLGGNIIVRDNPGGDVYLDKDVAMAVSYEGLGQDTHFGITLDSGLLTNRLFGQYHYEGGDLVYTVTYGDRSFTEPEAAASGPEQELPTQGTEAAPEKTGSDNTILYIGIGAIVAVVVLAAVAVVLLKKKKAGKAESK